MSIISRIPSWQGIFSPPKLKWDLKTPCLLFFLIFCVTPGVTQERQVNNIKGFVSDRESGEYLPYANVYISGKNIGTTTNTDGYFVLVNVKTGICTLTVEYLGYSTRQIIINNRRQNAEVVKVLTEQIAPIPIEDEIDKHSKKLRDIENDILEQEGMASTGRTFSAESQVSKIAEYRSSFLHIRLEAQLLEAEGVTVIAEDYQMWKTADEVGQITFSPQQISVLPSIGEADIFRSLQLLPGISGVNDASAGLYVRGGTPDQNLVMLDGMTVYHVDHFFGFFSAFNTDAIKDVQVFKGGYPAKYGGRLSSVVELTGKTGDINRKRLGVNANLLSAGAVFEMPFLNGKGSWIISGRRSYSDIIGSSLYNKLFDFITDGQATTTGPGPGGGPGGGFGQFQQETTRPDFYFYDLNSKLSYAPTEQDVFALSIYNGQDNMHDFQEIGGLRFGQDDASGTRGRDETTDWGNTGISLKWARRWADRFNSTVIVARSDYFSGHETDLSFNIESEDTSQVFRGGRGFASQEDNQITDLTFRWDNELHLSSAHRIGFGAWVSSTTTDYLATVNDSTEVLNQETESLLGTFYLQDKLQAFDRLEMTFGLRGSFYNQTEQLYLEPRASMQYALPAGFKLKGAWGQYNQFIHRIENEDVLEGSRDFWLVADENLEPGSSEHYIMGLSYETGKYLFEVESYYKDMTNLVEFSRRFRNEADFGNLFFFGEGISRGIEFLAQRKSGKLNGWLSYTLGEVEHTFAGLNDGDPFPASHDRTHELKFVGTYSFGRWSFGSTWVFASGQPYTSPSGQYEIELLDGTVQSYINVGDKNANYLPDYHRMDISASYKIALKNTHNWNGEVGLSVFNLYDHSNIWYRKYDLEVSPIVVTDVTMLGFTPTLYFKANF